jgi:SNF2 family DNA or RNA helicase
LQHVLEAHRDVEPVEAPLNRAPGKIGRIRDVFAQASRVKESAKLELLLTLLPSLIEEGRRVLVFSQFTGMLALIAEAATEAGIAFVMLTGQTTDRVTPVESKGGRRPHAA